MGIEAYKRFTCDCCGKIACVGDGCDFPLDTQLPEKWKKMSIQTMGAKSVIDYVDSIYWGDCPRVSEHHGEWKKD